MKDLKEKTWNVATEGKNCNETCTCTICNCGDSCNGFDCSCGCQCCL